MDEHEIKGTVREVAGKAEQVYGRAKEKVMRKVDDFAQQATDELPSEDFMDEALMLVQEHPASAIGISLLVGAGLGALLAYSLHD